jgi:hypothetical protein
LSGVVPNDERHVLHRECIVQVPGENLVDLRLSHVAGDRPSGQAQGDHGIEAPRERLSRRRAVSRRFREITDEGADVRGRLYLNLQDGQLVVARAIPREQCRRTNGTVLRLGTALRSAGLRTSLRRRRRAAARCRQQASEQDGDEPSRLATRHAHGWAHPRVIASIAHFPATTASEGCQRGRRLGARTSRETTTNQRYPLAGASAFESAS